MTRIRQADVLDGADVWLDADGWHANRAYIVDQIQGQAHQIGYLALTANGLPRYGEPHPSIPKIVCQQIRISKWMSPSQVTVTASYGPVTGRTRVLGAPALIRYGAGVIEVDTNRDVAGDLITVTYDHDRLQTTSAAGDKRTQTGLVRKQIPSMTFEITQVENRSPQNKQSYVGKLNKNMWLGFAARSLLCVGIGGESSDGGLTYNISYQFKYLGVDADPEIAYQNPDDDNRVPTDVVDGLGIKRVVIYESADFSHLGIRGISR